ncbi:MAG: hypothetical protein ABIX28_21180 [Vicinamibacterales bacterium]
MAGLAAGFACEGLAAGFAARLTGFPAFAVREVRAEDDGRALAAALLVVVFALPRAAGVRGLTVVFPKLTSG